jgi:GNAT superfamily N-acetyltransferase
MHNDRSPLFCDISLAARIERAEAHLVAAAAEATWRPRADGTGFVKPIAGGIASFVEEGSPFNKVAGLGFADMPSAEELDELERAFSVRGAVTQVELAHLADPDVGAQLTDRGYRLESFENVLGRRLQAGPEPVAVPGVEIRRSGDDEFDAWLQVQADAVAQPDTQGVPWHEEFPRDIYERAERDLAGTGLLRYSAYRNGTLAGGASFRLSDDIAQFTGAATAPAHRRHGVQTALLGARLADAAAAGCTVAVITVQPGSRSQENAQRCGFDLLYTRAILVKRR